MCKVKGTCLLYWHSSSCGVHKKETSDSLCGFTAADGLLRCNAHYWFQHRGGILILCCFLTVTDSPSSLTIVEWTDDDERLFSGHSGFGCCSFMRTYLAENMSHFKLIYEYGVTALNPVLACWSGTDSWCRLLVYALWLLMLRSPQRAQACLWDGCRYDRSVVLQLLCGTHITEGVSLGHSPSLTACLTLVAVLLPFSVFSPQQKNTKKTKTKPEKQADKFVGDVPPPQVLCWGETLQT